MPKISGNDSILDAVGVGIGPFNLSAAALLEPIADLRGLFFERREDFRWHPGLLLPEGSVQVSFLKDVVTLADPTSRFSFLSYLFAKRRLYRFIIAGFPKIKRLEFNDYFRWVSEELPNLRFGRPVAAVDYDGETLRVDLGDERLRTRNVILGTGQCPKIPACAEPYTGPTVFHSGEYLMRDVQPEGRRIAVIGGGQSGAELVNNLLSGRSGLPEKIHWIARRRSFLPLDDSPFVEEIFTPSYSDYFFSLPRETREKLLGDQKFASDGINHELLKQIYRRLYELEFLEGAGRNFSLRIDCELLDMSPAAGGGWTIRIHDQVAGRDDSFTADLVLLVTGFELRIPPCLEPLLGRIELEDGMYSLREDYSIEWDGPESLRIYAQNASRHCRGVPDPNLSLMAWRAATIVNSIAGRQVYDIERASSVFDWDPASQPQDLAELEELVLTSVRG